MYVEFASLTAGPRVGCYGSVKVHTARAAPVLGAFTLQMGGVSLDPGPGCEAVHDVAPGGTVHEAGAPKSTTPHVADPNAPGGPMTSMLSGVVHDRP